MKKERLNKNFLEEFKEYDFNQIQEDKIYLVGSIRFKDYFIKIESILQILYKKIVYICSIDGLLNKNKFSEDFSQIFTNWTIAIFINDCKLDSKYCYLNDNLKNLRVTPFIYFLPTSGESTLSVGYLTKEWAGNWQKIIGGKQWCLTNKRIRHLLMTWKQSARRYWRQRPCVAFHKNQLINC